MTVLGLVGSSLVAGMITAGSAQAATVYLGPVFSDAPSPTGFIGDSYSTAAGFSCPSGVVTSLVVDTAPNYEGTSTWVTAVHPSCSAVTGGASVTVGAVTGTGQLAGGVTPNASAPSSCPADAVAVGVQGRGGTITDAVQLVCRTVNPDGTLGATASFGAQIGGAGGSAQGPFLCPDPNGVVTSVSARTGDYLSHLTVGCRDMAFYRPLPDNTSWPRARIIGATSDTTDQAIETPGEQLWYALPVQPGSQVSVTLSDTTNTLDVAVFKDIDQAFTSLTSTQDLTHLSAEFAGDAFAPSVFSPSVFSPSVFSPSVFSPSVFSPSVFSPSVFSPSVFSPSVFSPSVFSGGAPDQSSLAQAFSSAQVRSLVGVAPGDGTDPKTVTTQTWNNTGHYFVRVTGRNGALSPFHLNVTTTGGPCNGLQLDDHATDGTLHGAPGPQTVILTDPNRMPGTDTDKAALATAVTSFARQVNGAVVDVGQSASTKVRLLNQQADTDAACPYAKNLAAQAIRDIVNSYRGPNLKYVVIVGGDSVIPFFRYADTAGLGPENGYYPPMLDRSASQASLRNNQILSQDAYGSAVDVSIKGTTLPVPDLSVGRLVEAPGEITATLTRYASTPVIRPSSTLVTGYDFLTDAADSVATDFAGGDPSGRNDTLITNQGVAPATTTVNGTPDRAHSWTATDLSHALLGRRHDAVFLAGHFSANSTLAADFSTNLLTTDLAASTTDFSNSLVVSAGCHSGYNVVDQDGVPGLTLGLDWAQAFAQKGATLVAGSGYQYGDTDFVAYSEKIYALLARDLREGTGPVAIGTKLVQAKQDYLATLTSVGGIDQKSLLESTLYGLPMQGVDFTGRLPDRTTSSSVSLDGTDVGGNGVGSQLGLQSYLLPLHPQPTAQSSTLTDAAGNVVHASYLIGPDGVATSPGAPTLPLQSVDVTATRPSAGVPGPVLRGVGLRTGTYTDADGIVPLTGAAGTEQSAAHGAFASPTFYPNRLATPNFYGALAADTADPGVTRLNVTPAQYRSDGGANTNTQRTYTDLGLQLFYSANRTTYRDPASGAVDTPALAAPPSISAVTATPSADGTSIAVSAHVVGDPSAGIDQAWITYTGERPSNRHGRWASVDLTQDAADSTLWRATVPVTDGDTADIRFLVQAANGVGEVGVDDNVGAYYATGVTPGALPTTTSTQLTLDPLSGVSADGTVHVGAAGTTLPVGARLTDGSGTALRGRTVVFSLGAAGVAATTDTAGHATAILPLTAAGTLPLTASFAGDTTARSSTSPIASIVVDKTPTALTLTRNASDGSLTATLKTTGGAALQAQTVTLVNAGTSGTVTAVPGTTGLDGSVTFPATAVPATASATSAWFGDPSTPAPTGTSNQTSPLYAASRSSVLRPGTVTITDSATGQSAGFGAKVTFSIAVSGPSGTSAVPTGRIRFSVDGWFIGTTTISAGRAIVATTALLPGRHTITVDYPGDTAFLPGRTTLTHTVTCAKTITGSVPGSVSATGTSLCVMNATIGGALNIGAGTNVAVVGSALPTSSITAKGSGQVMVCGSRTGGGIGVQGALGLVVIGDPWHSLCAPNTIGGSLVLQDDTHGVAAILNQAINVVTKNLGGTGAYPVFGDLAPVVVGNHT